MFGLVIRHAPQILFVLVFAAFVERILLPLISVASEGPAQESDPLIRGLEAVATPENLALAGIIGLVVAWLARSTLEGSPGRY